MWVRLAGYHYANDPSRRRIRQRYLIAAKL
jgi:hypothetical protein